MLHARIEKRWTNEPTIVVGSGPSLTTEVVHAVRMARWLSGWNVVVVNDAYKLLLCADVLYAADGSWWRSQEGAPSFEGERWSCHSQTSAFIDDKRELAQKYGLNLVQAIEGKDFSKSDRGICYGEQAHSGFQAVNLALLFGANPIVLCGFDYRGSHFFGEHKDLRNTSASEYAHLAKAFDTVTIDGRILNATPDSKLTRFVHTDLNEIIRRHDYVHRDRPVTHARAG